MVWFWIGPTPPMTGFSRFDKLGVVVLAFLNFALIVEALR